MFGLGFVTPLNRAFFNPDELDDVMGYSGDALS